MEVDCQEEERMQRKLSTILFMSLIVLLIGCSMEEWESVQHTSIQDSDTIVIDYRSTSVQLETTDAKELKTSILLYDSGPGIALDQRNGTIDIRIKSKITRLFSIQKPALTVSIPEGFTGDVILKGSSGNVTGEDLQMETLSISASSGNVDLTFMEYMTDTNISLSSGNVDVSVREVFHASIHLKSKSGSQSIDYVLNEQDQTKQRTTGTVGNGTYPLQIETSSGNIRLE